MGKKRQIEMHDEWVYRSEARTGRKKRESEGKYKNKWQKTDIQWR